LKLIGLKINNSIFRKNLLLLVNVDLKITNSKDPKLNLLKTEIKNRTIYNIDKRGVENYNFLILIMVIYLIFYESKCSQKKMYVYFEMFLFLLVYWGYYLSVNLLQVKK